MKTMLRCALIVLSLFAVSVACQATPVHVRVPPSPPPVPGKMKVAAASTGIDVTLYQVLVAPDGSAHITLTYKNASGASFTTRTVNIPALRSSPILDQNSNQLSATVPAGLGNAIDAFVTALQSTITTAAAGGKLDL